MAHSGMSEILSGYQEFLPDVVSYKDEAVYAAAIPSIRRIWELERNRLRSTHPGQYVAIIPERIIALSPDWREAQAAIDRLSPAPDCYAVFEVGNDSILYPSTESEKQTG